MAIQLFSIVVNIIVLYRLSKHVTFIYKKVIPIGRNVAVRVFPSRTAFVRNGTLINSNSTMKPLRALKFWI